MIMNSYNKQLEIIEIQSNGKEVNLAASSIMTEHLTNMNKKQISRHKCCLKMHLRFYNCCGKSQLPKNGFKISNSP